MTDQFDSNTPDVLDDNVSVDDLIADIKQQIDTAPGEAEIPYEETPLPQEADLPAPPDFEELTTQEDDFTPDFGDDFKCQRHLSP